MTMPKYIEREALIKMIETKAANLKLFRSLYTGQSARALEHLVEQIAEMPAADVVEVVRCKDCFFYQKDKELAKANYLDSEKYCALLKCENDKNGFCSYGKKE